MARQRTLHPDFFVDEKVVQVSAFARLMFQGLWCLADREGRLERKPLKLKMQLFPADNLDAELLLGELESVGLVRRYEVEGRDLLILPGFLRRQNPHPKEVKSVLPAPPTIEEQDEISKAVESNGKPRKATASREKVGASRAGSSGSSGSSDLAAPASRAPELTDLLVAEFSDTRRSKYVHSGPKDGAALKRLMAAATDEEILTRWRRGLAEVGFHQVNTFAQLAQKWNDLTTAGPPNLKAPIRAETQVFKEFGDVTGSF